MDNLFKNRVLTTAVNNMVTPSSTIFNRFFRPKAKLQISDRLAFDVITGSQRVLPTISPASPATVTKKTDRTTITLQAPRIAAKRNILAADLNAVRAYGQQMANETMQDRIAAELMDMRNETDRTLEFWATQAMKGKIYDSDGTTLLVDYGLAGTHEVTLLTTDLWTDTTNSNPMTKLREWMRLIEDDSLSGNITGWQAYCGYEVMDALLSHPKVLNYLQYQKGVQIVESGKITDIAGWKIEEYLGSFLTAGGTRTRFINSDQIILIGVCDDLVDCPFAPIVDSTVAGGVGNVVNNQGLMYASKSWAEEDPEGRWIKVETRPLPVLQRPGAVVIATVV